jgi:hypothetical protein
VSSRRQNGCECEATLQPPFGLPASESPPQRASPQSEPGALAWGKAAERR